MKRAVRGPVGILTGTVSGTASIASQAIAAVLIEGGLRVVEMPYEPADSLDCSALSALVVCTSTYGSGDVPDNLQTLYEGWSLDRPSVSGLKFAVFGLGDSTFGPTFNQAARRFDAVLELMDGVRVLEPCFMDAAVEAPNVPHAARAFASRLINALNGT